MAVRCGARLKVPGTFVLGGLRTVRPFAGRERQDSVGQRATLAEERRVDRRRGVRA